MTDEVVDNAPFVSAPKPEEQRRTIAKLVAALMDLDAAYSEAFAVAYGRWTSDAFGSGAVGGSDPTGAVTVAGRQRRLRKDLKTAAQSLDAAVADVKAARFVVKRGMEADGINALADGMRVIRQEREGGIPPPLHRAEIDPLKAAQRRRRERGDE